MTGKRGAIYEMLAMAAVAALCAAISAGCAVKYGRMARDAHALDVGLGRVQSVCDFLAGSGGDMAGLNAAYGIGPEEPFILYFDRDFEPSGPEAAAYAIQAGYPERDGLLGTACASLSRADGSVIFEAEASWQEEAF